MPNLSQIMDTFKGKKIPDFTPVVPIYHTAAALGAGVTLKDYASNSSKMAETMLWAYNKFRFDGVQLTLGVGMEAEALGAKTEQAEKGLPTIKEHLLKDILKLKQLKIPDIKSAGRMPVFLEAVKIVQETIGRKAVVIPTVRGPLVLAGQLRGISDLMLDSYDNPDFMKELLDFCTELCFCYANSILENTGVRAIAFGEALCSPDFISPEFYKEIMAPFHKKLVQRIHAVGLEVAIIHICGNILPIFDTFYDTGFDTADIDAKTDLKTILKLNKASKKTLGLRGNIDPSWLFQAGESEVKEKSQKLLLEVGNNPWILSSGCDVPYGTPDANMSAMTSAAKK